MWMRMSVIKCNNTNKQGTRILYDKKWYDLLTPEDALLIYAELQRQIGLWLIVYVKPIIRISIQNVRCILLLYSETMFVAMLFSLFDFLQVPTFINSLLVIIYYHNGLILKCYVFLLLRVNIHILKETYGIRNFN